MKTLFLENSYKKCGGKTSARPFSKRQNWGCLWISIIKFYTVCIYCMPSWGLSKQIEILWLFTGISDQIISSTVPSTCQT